MRELLARNSIAVFIGGLIVLLVVGAGAVVSIWRIDQLKSCNERLIEAQDNRDQYNSVISGYSFRWREALNHLMKTLGDPSTPPEVRKTAFDETTHKLQELNDGQAHLTKERNERYPLPNLKDCRGKGSAAQLFMGAGK